MSCSTRCDDDCENFCHEWHQPICKMVHDPIECEKNAVSLYATIWVTNQEDHIEVITEFKIVRAGRDYSKNADSVHDYWVKVDDQDIGQVSAHRYGDGSVALVDKAIALYENLK